LKSSTFTLHPTFGDHAEIIDHEEKFEFHHYKKKYKKEAGEFLLQPNSCVCMWSRTISSLPASSLLLSSSLPPS
jgi:hypothetical protein